jgi:Protein SCAI
MKLNNLQELDKQIVDYTSTYEPDDQLEWSLVLEEIKSFIKSDSVISVLHADSNPIILSHRLVIDLPSFLFTSTKILQVESVDNSTGREGANHELVTTGNTDHRQLQ